MGMEIGPDPIRKRDLELDRNRMQKEEIKAREAKQASEAKSIATEAIKNDSIQKRQLHEIPLKQSEKMNRPLLRSHTSRFERMSDALINARKEFDLPSPRQLLHKLSPEVQEKVQNVIDEAMFNPGSGPKIMKFFDILSRLIPLGSSLLHGLGSDDHVLNLPQLRESMINMLKETGQMMMKHGDSTILSQEGEQLTQLLSEQLLSLPTDGTQTQALNEQLRAILGNTITPNTELISHGSVQHFTDEIDTALAKGGSEVSVTENQQLIDDLVDADLLPPSTLDRKTVDASLLKELKTELENFQKTGATSTTPLTTPSGGYIGKPMAPTIGFLATFLSNIGVFPESTQAEVIKVMISTQPVLTYNMSNRALAPHTVHFAHSLSHMSVNLAQELGLIPDHPAHMKSVSEYFTRIFAGLIITAAVLGRLEVDRGDGKSMRLDDEEAGKAQRMAAQELEIHDLPPFSFFALWAPFADLQPDHHKEHRKAAAALSDFMRILMRLVYLLVAIYTGGHKLGKNGIETLLEENQVYLLNCLDDLIFSLKTLNEKFGVKATATIERCELSKKALLDANYQEFWHQIFSALQEKSSLKDFLEEVHLVDNLYRTIRTLVSGSGFDTSVVRM